jgi:hypothetical protein
MARYGRAPCDFFVQHGRFYDTDVIRRYIISDLEGLAIGGEQYFLWWLLLPLTGFSIPGTRRPSFNSNQNILFFRNW